MLIGGPPLPPRDPPLGERRGGRGREAPPRPRREEGVGKEGEGEWKGTWVRLDREGVCSFPWRGQGVGKGKEVGEGECRLDLWVEGRRYARYRQTDRKYTGEVEEGKGRGADRKEWGNRRDKWLVT